LSRFEFIIKLLSQQKMK